MAHHDLVTSTNYAHPHRPLPLKLANRLAGVANGLGLGRSFEPARLMADAQKNTGEKDFGDPFFQKPLEMLAQAIDREAHLHAMGRQIMRGRLVSTLSSRLRIEALYRHHPEIDQIPVGRPIVIAGLQRSGTTVLQRLIAADPGARALAAWEALCPAPLPNEGREGSDLRRRAARVAERATRLIYPEFFAVHPIEADAPEEDVLLLDLSFTSQSAEAILHVPSYAAWLETIDQLPAYRHLVRTLKALLWQRSGQFWVLKTPHHMEYMRELLTVFPDAVVVQTHRDPLVTTSSFCSMVAHGRAIFSDQIDPREIGRHWLRKARRMIDHTLAVRDGGQDSSFVDVSYYDLMADPMAQVRRIYLKAGRELTSQAEAAMQEVLARDRQHRYGRHVYRNTDFGLSRAVIEATLGDYRRRFDIRRENPDLNGVEVQLKASGIGHTNPITATATAIYDVFRKRDALLPIGPEVRLDGKTAMVTGANSGLGKAVATELARRGAKVLMACRSGIPQAGEDVARAAGSPTVEMLKVDLADLATVVELTDELARRKVTLDLLVCNAGLMPSKARRTAQGYEVMFGVHYLANHLLTRRLLASGVIPNEAFARNGRSAIDIPRIVFVSSETHRSSPGLDFARFGEFVDYGLRDGMEWYGTSKLAMVTLATELSRRLTTSHGPSVGVHSLCPGPINSNIAREAPSFSKPLLKPVMSAFFRSPEDAAQPVMFLGAAPELAGETGWYLHLMRRKLASPAAIDPENGTTLWEKGEALLKDWLAP
jgi:NAD(P)-dependent dehydrogenase (short-subunit alcohol dehydrogenase family)